jgi:hypothetical protein
MPPEDNLSSSPHDVEIQRAEPVVADPPRLPTGELGAFALLGAAMRSVPIPWLPNTLAQRLRGALVQDIANRHGVVLSPNARATLASPEPLKRKHGPMSEAFAYLGRKLFARLGRLAVLLPVRAALETYVLGYLFDRYLSRTPRGPRARFEVREARLVRRAIEQAIVRIASAEGGLRWVPPPPPPEESRDELTQLLDSLLASTTLVPSWLLQRLDAAFNDALNEP